METNYDKVEQSNGGKNMRFFEYLKKQELTPVFLMVRR